VEHGCFENWIRRVAMGFPVAIEQIDFDGTVNWFAAVDPNCRVAKIRTVFTVPNTELDDIDLIAIRADELPSEISGKPAGLQLQL
jgi:hypothetical protein